MATVTSSKRHLQLTSDTYESNGVVTIGGDNLYFDGSTTNLRSDNVVSFLTDGGAAQTGQFKSLRLSTTYSGGTIPNNGILFYNDTNLYRSAANTLTTDDSLVIAGDTSMVTGHSSGKFAVMSTSVHASYDFYNDGTSYFNGSVTIDDNLSLTGDTRILNLAGGSTTNSQSRLIIGEQGTYGVSFRWNSGSELEFDGFWNSSVTGTRNRDLGSIDVNNRIWYLNNNVTVGGDLTVSGGDITLSGTGRIQGIDTVSANTDAANKLYVDNAVAGNTDADTLDSLDSTQFLRSDANDTATGVITIDNDLYLGTYAGTTQARIFLTGTTANKQSIIQTTNGNLHIDSEDGHSLYLNYYEGTTDNVVIGTGNGGSSGTILKSTGRVNVGEHLIAANNVYAGGTDGFVFGSSTSEGEYIKRDGNDIAFIAGGYERVRVDNDVNGTGDHGLGIGNGGRLGFDESGTRSWTVKATSGQLQFISGDNGGSIYFGSSLHLNNKGISGVDSLAFNDPGPSEGITWSGGNFKIYESPDDLTTNTAGNLQFVSGSTRVVSIGKTGETTLQVIGSGSTVLDIQGSQGQLFSITDDLTGDLFSVSDISGVPILNVNASGDSYFDGNLDVSGSLNVTGSAFFNGNIGNSPAANPGVHIGISAGNDGQIQIIGTSAHIDFSNAGSEDYDARIILEGNDELNVAGVGNNFQVNGNRVLTTADEGSGNGIDADTLDGNHASAFLTSESDTLATVTGRGATTSTTCTFDTVTINTPIVGSAAKLRFANNDYLRYDDTANRFHFDADGGTSNASVQAATFVGALSGNASTATNVAWSGITSKPTTLSGFGITDAISTSTTQGSNLYIRNGSPTIYLRDTDHISSMIHQNSNLFYILRADAADDISWTTHATSDDANGRWPLVVNLANSGNYFAIGSPNVTAGGNTVLHTGNYSSWNRDDRYYTESEVDTKLNDKTNLNDIRSLGTQAFTGTATTAGFISEMEGDGAFDSYSSVFKTSWSYAGNFNLSDAGRFTETAGASFLTWTDNSSDTTRGNITVLAIAPNTGGSAGKMFVYNDQGSSYSPGWREIWTSTSDGAGSGLDADLLDGQEGSYYTNAGNLTGTIGDVFTPSTRYNIGLIDGSSSQTRDKIRVWTSAAYSIGMKSGYDYGHLGSGEYAMSFQMNNNNGRGWWWGDDGHTDDQGAMSLTTNGKLTVATSVSIGQGESITSPSSTTLYVNGTIQATSDVVAYQSSDERLKDNVTPIDNAVDKVKQLGGYEFDWNDKQDTYEGHDVGVLAQEVEKVLPEVVEEREDGYKAVKYEKIVPLLIEGIKEQQKQIDELKAIVNKLQNEK